jgi:hypothetical protein
VHSGFVKNVNSVKLKVLREGNGCKNLTANAAMFQNAFAFMLMRPVFAVCYFYRNALMGFFIG